MHMPEFDVALHTSMRNSEQFSLGGPMCYSRRKRITLEKPKNGSNREIPYKKGRCTQVVHTTAGFSNRNSDAISMTHGTGSKSPYAKRNYQIPLARSSARDSWTSSLRRTCGVLLDFIKLVGEWWASPFGGWPVHR